MKAKHPVPVGSLLAEAFGTFCLVLVGTGAIVINDVSAGAITHVGIALSFGLVVYAMIHTVGPISGAHLNPAVTLGLTAAGRFDVHKLLPYVASQLCGAFVASLCMRLLFPQHPTLGITTPAHTAMQSWFLEGLLTAILVAVILTLSTRDGAVAADVAGPVGAVIGMEAMFAGPISGASMNPARSIAPAIVSLQIDNLWIYVVAPLVGAALAAIIFRACWPTSGQR